MGDPAELKAPCSALMTGAEGRGLQRGRWEQTLRKDYTKERREGWVLGEARDVYSQGEQPGGRGDIERLEGALAKATELCIPCTDLGWHTCEQT